MSIMSERAPQDVIREDQETYPEDFVPCLCRPIMTRQGEVEIVTDHCELHGPKPGTAKFAQTEQAEAERRLANGE